MAKEAEEEIMSLPDSEKQLPEQGLETVPGKKRWDIAVDKISYLGIVKNMPYLLFLTLLVIVYMANNNYAISLVREIDNKNKELKQLHWRYLDLQSRLMFQTTESQLKMRTAALGLNPLQEPAFIIKTKQKNN